MKPEEVEDIMDDITDDSSLCVIRNALEEFDNEEQDLSKMTDKELADLHENARNDLGDIQLEETRRENE